MLNIKNLQFGYNKKNLIFNNLNLSLKKGNIIGLLGKNGAGKTSLMNLIVGILNNYKGEILFNNFDTKSPSPEFIKNYYYVPDTVFLPSCSIKKFVDNYSVFYDKFDKNYFFKCLQDFEIESNGMCKNLSSGNSKKVLLSFAFATNTDLLILDEPTNSLDISSKKIFREKLLEISNMEKTVIISSHQVKDFENIIDPIVILNDKKIIFNDSIDNLFKNIEFSLEQNLSDDTDIIFSMKVQGGYAIFRKNFNPKNITTDLELIFNTLIDKDQAILNYYKETKGETR